MESSKTSDKDLLFVGISFKLIVFLLFARFFNWRIHVFDNSNVNDTNNRSILDFQRKMLQFMHKHHLIIRVTEQHLAIFNSHSLSIELANKAVNKLSGNEVIKLASQLYKSKETDLVFKKIISKHISLLTSINQYILNNKKIKSKIYD